MKIREGLSNYLFRLLVLSAVIILFYSCSGNDIPLNSPTDNLAEERSSEWDSLLNIVNNRQDRNRFVWQKPNIILNYFGNIEGQTIADIGAGSGYFTLLIPQKGANVIAIDIDQYALQGIDETMHLPNYPMELREKIDLRLVKEDDPQLDLEEVDGVIIVNTITFIADRQEYLLKIMKGLKPGGKILIVDYKTKRIPLSIPLDQRLPLYQVEEDLYKAGFSFISVDECSLDYQYILTGEKR